MRSRDGARLARTARARCSRFGIALWLTTGSLAFVSTGLGAADQPARGGVAAASRANQTEEAAKKQKEWEAYQAKQRERAKRYQEERRKQFEEMERLNPEEYQKVKVIDDRNEAIERILAALRAQKIDRATARKQLTPFVKAQADEELVTAEERIASMKQNIEVLERLKKDSKEWIKGQVDELLGPEPRPPQQ